MIFSCKGCQNRHPACHASCETYKAELEEYLQLKSKNRDLVASYVAQHVIRSRDISAKRRQARPLKSGCIR